jgi:chemotaxis protein MotB
VARKFKKVDGGHGHHGGAWKVAYADFVTAMMALFMVLWLLASTDSQSRKEISNYFRTGLLPAGDLSPNHASQAAPSMFQFANTPPPKGEESFDERADTAKTLLSRLERIATADGQLAEVMKNVHVQVTSDGILIDAVDEGNGLLFDMSSSRLNEPLERFLRALGPAVAAFDKPVEINGHTDARPFAPGARISNWDLSYLRAAAAREILEAAGLPPERVTGVFARGSSQLYVPDDPLAPQNRRLSILVRIAKPADTKLAAAAHEPAN